jgi:hypothetical protein
MRTMGGANTQHALVYRALLDDFAQTARRLQWRVLGTLAPFPLRYAWVAMLSRRLAVPDISSLWLLFSIRHLYAAI